MADDGLDAQFRQSKFPDLFRFCSAKTTPDTRSFDEISALAIREIWLRLRSSPIRQTNVSRGGSQISPASSDLLYVRGRPRAETCRLSK
jgi:hypothetical protein